MTQASDSRGRSDFDISALPDWAQKIFADPKPTIETGTSAIAGLAGSAAWPVMVKAATVSSFSPGDLVRAVGIDDEDRQQAEKSVMSFAEPLHIPAGTWALTQDARQSILSLASEQEIRDILSRAPPTRDDLVSVALRDQLSGTAGVQSGALPALEAARTAADWLSGSKHGHSVNLDELDREIALRRLLKPFRKMVGVSDDDASQIDPSKIRFFGREDELTKLRDYVGVLPAASRLQALSRFVTRAKHAVLGAKPLIIWGIGGVGKTTLVAKFALEHAEVASSRYPFAYLDFDRSTVSARRPELLLAEMCAQVGAQFADLTEKMRSIEDRARAFSIALDSHSESASPDSRVLGELRTYLPEGTRDVATFAVLLPLLTEFRQAVDAHIASLESMLELKRPFLLVLDTFEIVQYSDADVRRVEDFVRVLTSSANGLRWARLRLVISGRKKLAKFLERIPQGEQEIGLGALDRTGCIQMLSVLTADAKKPIATVDAARLVDAMMAAPATGKPSGLHPLSLKLLGSVFETSTEPDTKVLVPQLLDELANQGSNGGPLGKALIDGILVRRIVDHVADPRVRSLADPGLVVRRITPAVIREVMARGTPRPGSSENVVNGDGLDFEPWELSTEERWPGGRDEAEDIFEAFSREVSLVEPDSAGLRHRQDLRQEMLPLIAARRPARFRLLHQLAFGHFEKCVAADRADREARAEAIYHGLWLDLPLEQIDQFWPTHGRFEPRLDPDEFEHMPAALRYIKAKTRQPMFAQEIKLLPRRIAAEWLVSREDSFLNDDYPNDVARAASAATGENYEGLDDYVTTAAAVARLLYRTGQWHDSRSVIARQIDNIGSLGADGTLAGVERVSGTAGRAELEARVSLVRTWATISAKLGAELQPLEIASRLGNEDKAVGDPLVRAELLSFATLGHRMMKDRSGWSELKLNQVGSMASEAARQVTPNLWPANTRTLRFTILAAPDEANELLQAYLGVRDYPPRDEEAGPYVGRILALAYGETGAFNTAHKIEEILASGSNLTTQADYFRELWNEGLDRIQASMRQNLEVARLLKKVLTFQHHDWIWPLGNSLSRAFEGERGGALRKALIQQSLLADLRSRESVMDGLSIVEWAAADGKLLRLAATIDEFSDEFSTENKDMTDSYPETVFGIAEALLVWHDVILDRGGAGDLSPPPRPNVSNPKPRESSQRQRRIKRARTKR